MNNKYGQYYTVDLFRRRGEMMVIGVGLQGQIISVMYDGRYIKQWDGLDAEAFIAQSCEQSGWERGRDMVG